MQPNLKLLLSLLVILSSIQSVRCTENRMEQLERIVGKLQDTILLVSKDNVKYKRLVEDLELKVNKQEERIGTLEKGCKIETRIASSRATKKRVGYYNDSFNEAIEGLNANMPFWRKKVKPNTFIKRTSISDRGDYTQFINRFVYIL